MNPKPEELAKVIIWNFACIRTDLHEINTKLDLIAAVNGLDTTGREELRKTISDMRTSVFLATLAAVGIEAGEGWPPIDPNR